MVTYYILIIKLNNKDAVPSHFRKKTASLKEETVIFIQLKLNKEKTVSEDTYY
jgi:hypothetical protein